MLTLVAEQDPDLPREGLQYHVQRRDNEEKEEQKSIIS